jgi:pimeloyl-ACP methyl ester carboxylesterase
MRRPEEEIEMARSILGFAAIAVILAAGLFLWFNFTNSDDHAEPSVEFEQMASPYWSGADQMVTVDGLPVRVRIEGPVDAPVLVMIHGFSFSLETWDSWASELRQDYRIIRMDLPGHGLTGPDPQTRYSVDQTVSLIGSMLDALHIEDAILVGNSLGGLVSWKLAVLRPYLVDRLVLIAPGAYSINGVTQTPVAVPAGVAFYLTQSPQIMIDAATASLFGDPSRMDPELPVRVGDLMRGEGVGQALVDRLTVFTLPDPVEELTQIDQPTLVLWGALDVMVPVAHAERIVNDLPAARLVIHDDLGHVPHEEAPEQTLVAVLDFLNE